MAVLTLSLVRSRPATLRGVALGATLLIAAAGFLAQREVLGIQWLPRFALLWAIVGSLGLGSWLLADRVLPASPMIVNRDWAAVPTRRLALSWLLGTFSLLCLAAAVVLLWRDLASPTGAWLWLASLFGLVAAVAIGDPVTQRIGLPIGLSGWLWAGVAAAVVLLAFVLRIAWLDTLPATLNNDEGEIADMGLNVLNQAPLSGQHVAWANSIFQTGWGTSPLLDPYFQALVMQVAGETVFGLRLSSAVAGGLGVLLLYWLLKDYVQAWAAAAAALLMAVSHVHLFWTRFALPQAKLALLCTAVILLLLRGMRSGRRLDFALAGLFLGLAQYTYQGARLMVPVVGLFFLYLIVRERQFLRQRWSHMALTVAMSVAVFSPLGIWFWFHPNELFSRTGAVMILNDQAYLRATYPDMNTVQIVLEQLRKSLEGLAFTGDRSGAFYPVREPLVDPIVGAALLLGVLGLTFSYRRPERFVVALWIWIPVFLTCTVTIDPPPMTRLFMMFPALYFVVGVVLDRIGRVAEIAAGRRALAPLGLICLVAIGFSAFWNYRIFFDRYPRQLPAGTWTEAGRLVRAAGPEFKTYTVGPPHLFFHNSTMRFLAREMAGEDLKETDIPVAERGHRHGLFLVAPPMAGALDRLRAAYPNGEAAEHRTWRDELLFTSYRVDREELLGDLPSDAPWRQHDQRFGVRGAAFGQFEDGRALSVDGEGRVYLADRGNGSIDVFDHGGQPIGELGQPGTGEADFRGLWSVAIGPDGTIFGLDRHSRWIQRFDAEGRWLGKVGGPTVLGAPLSMAVASDGTIFVADTGKDAIVRLSPHGVVMARREAAGSGPGEFKAPSAVAVAADGTVYVVDSGNQRVQRLSADLDYVGQWSIPRPLPEAGGLIAVADADGGAVYVVDSEGGRVNRFGPDGTPEWSIGEKRGDGPLQFMLPVAVTTDRAGNVFVLDGTRHRVYRFDVSRRIR